MMSCQRPPRRNHIPAIFRRRERMKLEDAARRHIAKTKRENLLRQLRGVVLEFPMGES